MTQIRPTGGGHRRLFAALAFGLISLLALSGCGHLVATTTPPPMTAPKPTEAPKPMKTPTAVPATQASSLTKAPGATVAPTTAPTSMRPATPVAATPIIIIVTATPTPLASATPTAIPASALVTFDYPATTSVDKSELVTVQIEASALVAAVGLSPGPGPEVFEDRRDRPAGSRMTISGQVLALRFVRASLRAPEFEVLASEASPWQPLTPETPAAWSWYLVAKKPDRASITLDIFGKNDVSDEYSVLIKEYTVDVSVSDRPLLERIQDYVGANLAVIASLFTSGGLVTLLVERLLKSLAERTDKRRDKKHK